MYETGNDFEHNVYILNAEFYQQILQAKVQSHRIE